jgi:hypothetical protein
MKIFTLFLLALCPVLAGFGCAVDRLAGGTGEETTNGRVSGTVVYPDGTPAPGSQVKIIPDHYDPLKDTAAILLDTTNDSGKYIFAGIPYGTYTVQSVQCSVRTRAIAFGIVIARDTVSVASLELQKTGVVKVMLPGGISMVNGYVYVPGSDIAVFLHGEAASAVMDSVPAGLMPSVNYGALNSTSPLIIRFDVRVLPGDTTLVAEPDWKYSKRLFLNTTASGAALLGNVTGFPVLVRLTRDNFVFSQAAAGGVDLRFTKPDGAQLPYEIERYDPVTEHAEVWVRVDTIFGSDSSHYVNMYWGNSAQGSTSISRSAAVFDTAIGFQGVWHFAEAGNAAAKDATINGYDGTPSNMTAASSVAGAIGNARNFDGSSSSIQMIGTAMGKLNFNENDYYTISAWVNTDTLYSDTNAPRHDLTIVAKDNCQYMMKCFRGDFAFVQYKDAAGWATSMSPAVVATWKYVVGVCAGTRQYLYVDGVLSADSANFLETSTRARYSASDVFIGKTPSGSNNWSPYFFKGKIDEVRIGNKALSADWIKLCYMNQKTDDKLVIFK